MVYSAEDIELAHADKEPTPLVEMENVGVVGIASVFRNQKKRRNTSLEMSSQVTKHPRY